MLDLTVDELATLHARLGSGARPAFTLAEAAMVKRLLAELERRRAAEVVGVPCPHGGVHPRYCAGCCAELDTKGTGLRHQADCVFQFHVRAG